MEKDIILEIKEISKSFGGIEALKDISLVVQKGEIIGVIGPNGSGKTTLINVITGFTKPDKGRIIYKKRDITGMKPYQIADMGIIRSFQVIKPFYGIPAYKNVVIPLCSNRVKKIRGGRYGRRDEVALDLLEEMGFERDSRIPYKETSSLPHGYLKRLELARCIVLQPEILILDEIFCGMSKAEVASTIPIIKRLHDRGLTIIMVEHRIKELLQIANRIMVLNFGKKIADGSSHEVIQKEEVKSAYIGGQLS
ncbi:MAG: ABC transporter ATP-binding protein [Deltaproteobacteria bacterium]|nr:MAG: ABC transporter ATP-binding protein [Deltaproteobacteria bacterium]